MSRKTLWAAFGAASWAAMAACGGGGDSHPPGIPTPTTADGGSSSGAGSSSGGSSSGGGDASASDDANLDGSFPVDGSTADAHVSQASDASMSDPACSPNQTWSAPSAVPGVPVFPSTMSAPLVAMSSDELTVAWVIDTGGGTGDVFAADRSSTSASFGAAAKLTASPLGGGTVLGPDGSTLALDAGSGYFAFDRVALSADGLRLVGVAIGEQHLALFTRASRSLPFDGAPMESYFSAIAGSLMAGEKIGDPVLSSDGNDFVFSKYGNSPTLSIYESIKGSGSGFGSGTGQGAAALAFSQSVRKVPTSITADRRVLFVWDGAANKAYGVLRATTSGQFNFAIDLGNRPSAQVNADCSRLYFVASTSTGYALEVTSSS